ncbi:hypothetical protein PDE01_13800 [Paracoccus denitrificans]|nr:hypothetical protein PDE01_13800 [Paracoccus denitrificans]
MTFPPIRAAPNTRGITVPSVEDVMRCASRRCPSNFCPGIMDWIIQASTMEPAMEPIAPPIIAPVTAVPKAVKTVPAIAPPRAVPAAPRIRVAM